MGKTWKLERQNSDSKITLYLHGRPDHCVYNDLDSCDKLQEEAKRVEQVVSTSPRHNYHYSPSLQVRLATDHSCWLCEQPNMLAISPLLGTAINNTPLCPHGTGEMLSSAIVLCCFLFSHTTRHVGSWFLTETDPVPPAMQVGILNHWTAQGSPSNCFLFPSLAC